MLFHLLKYLNGLYYIPGGGLMQYITFRAIVAAVLALGISIWFGKHFIAYMKRHHISETQRDAKEDPFNTKKVGVPTMGGIIIIVAILIPCLLLGDFSNVYFDLMLFTMLLLGALGFADDYIKTFKKDKGGLKPRYKLIGQIALGLIVGLTLRMSPQVTMNETVERQIVNNKEVWVKSPDVKSTRTTIPFVKNHNANYADLFSFLGNENKYRAGWIFFCLLITFVVAGTSNGANLNDGMDGMAAGNSAIMGATLLVIAYMSGTTTLAAHLNIMYIPGSGEIVVFLAAFVGALIGFLWYNFYPAQVFMGDTGSLMIGGVIAVAACMTHKEWLLPILCGVWVMEALSSFLQTRYFVSGKKKGVHRRIWTRAPIHDYYRTTFDDLQEHDPGSTVIFKSSNEPQLETKIVIRFWLVTIMLAAFTLLTFKIR